MGQKESLSRINSSLIGFTLFLILCVAQAKMWIETKPINPNNSTGGVVGSFGGVRSCPAGSFVNGYQLSIGQHGLAGLSLQCSQLDSTDNFKNVAVLTTGDVAPISYQVNTYATGFSFQTWTEKDGQEFLGLWQLLFQGQDSFLNVPDGSTDVRRSLISCPFNWAICGFQARAVDEKTDSGKASRTLTKLKFKCCYYCVPEEVEVVIRDITNDGTTDMSTEIRKTIGLTVNQASNEDRHNTESTDNGRDMNLSKNRQSISTQSQSVSEGGNELETEGTSSHDNRVNTSAQSSTLTTNFHNSAHFGQTSGTENRLSSTSGRNYHSAGSTRRQNTFSRNSNTHSSQNVNTGSDYGASSGMGGSRGKGSGSNSGWNVGANAGVGIGPVNIGVSGGYNTGKNEYKSQDQNWNTNNHGASRFGQDQSSSHGTQVGEDMLTDEGRESGKSENTHNGNERNYQESLQSGQALSTDENNSRQMHASNQIGRDEGRSRSYNRGRSSQKEDSRVENDLEGIQEMLAARYGQSKAFGFTWAKSASSMQQHEKNEVDTFVCEAGHRCVLKQLVRKCGSVEFYTPKLIKSSQPLKSDPESESFNPDEPTMQNWLETKTTSLYMDSTEGVLDNPDICPPASFVTGAKFGYFEGTVALAGVELECSTRNYLKQFLLVSHVSAGQSKDSVRSDYISQLSRGQVPANGFAFFSSTHNESFPPTESHSFLFNGELNSGEEVPDEAVIQAWQCPHHYKVCGISAYRQQAVIIQLMLKCCYYCVPTEKLILLHSFANGNEVETTEKVEVTTGLSATEEAQLSTRVEIGAIFAQMIGNSTLVPTFKWDELSGRFWKTPNSKTDTAEYNCPARHTCTFKQLMGTCGEFHVYSPHTFLEAIPRV